MSAGITQEQFAELRQEIAEAKWLAYSTICALSGKKKADTALREVQRFIQGERLRNGTPIFGKLGNHAPASGVMFDADIWTLEEAAARGRNEVAALPEIGTETMGRLDAALAEHSLAWAKAS